MSSFQSSLANMRNHTSMRWLLPLLAGLVAGLFLGLVIGWVVWPVEWKGAYLSELVPEARAEYLSAVADSYVANPSPISLQTVNNRLQEMTSDPTSELNAAASYFLSKGDVDGPNKVASLMQMAGAMGLSISSASTDYAATANAGLDTTNASPPLGQPAVSEEQARTGQVGPIVVQPNAAALQTEQATVNSTATAETISSQSSWFTWLMRFGLAIALIAMGLYFLRRLSRNGSLQSLSGLWRGGQWGSGQGIRTMERGNGGRGNGDGFDEEDEQADERPAHSGSLHATSPALSYSGGWSRPAGEPGIANAQSVSSRSAWSMGDRSTGDRSTGDRSTGECSIREQAASYDAGNYERDTQEEEWDEQEADERSDVGQKRLPASRDDAPDAAEEASDWRQSYQRADAWSSSDPTRSMPPPNRYPDDEPEEEFGDDSLDELEDSEDEGIERNGMEEERGVRTSDLPFSPPAPLNTPTDTAWRRTPEKIINEKTVNEKTINEKVISEDRPRSKTAIGSAPAMRYPGAKHLASFDCLYQTGIPDYEQSYPVEDAAKKYIGECGMGISTKNRILHKNPDEVIALEVWLFDKSDERNLSNQMRILMSEYASDRYADAFSKESVSAVRPFVAQPGTNFQIEGRNLVLNGQVVDVAYTRDGIFQMVKVRLDVLRR